MTLSEFDNIPREDWDFCDLWDALREEIVKNQEIERIKRAIVPGEATASQWLEVFIDKMGLDVTLNGLIVVAHNKSNRFLIDANDKESARIWTRIKECLDKASKQIFKSSMS